jgi:4-carboxymuconolactone decarboxylase
VGGVTDLDRVGERVRRAVLGDEHVNRAAANATEFTAPFHEYVTRSAWGQVWSRSELDIRTRSLVTLALLTALRCEDELAMHVAAALRLGITPAEIREVLLHTAVYAGAPAANAAFATAAKVLGTTP